jgi:hypothetical protein
VGVVGHQTGVSAGIFRNLLVKQVVAMHNDLLITPQQQYLSFMNASQWS